MNNINSDKSNFFMERILISFYFKKIFKNIRLIFCLIFILIPLANSFIAIQNLINSSVEINQITLDSSIFLGSFLSFSIIYANTLPIIISCDIISEDFSKKTALVLYSAVSRKKVMISKILSITSYLLFFQSISFIIFSIMSFVTLGLVISVNISILGFFLIFINMIFIFSLTFCFSALTRNTIMALLIPLFYTYNEQLLILFNLKFLSYNQQVQTILLFIQSILLNGNVSLDYIELLISFIIFFSLPLIIFIITYKLFKRVDIRL
ncbi:MAG: ABC-2 family transporter protein [Candidatus Lokiarchaeum sp. GC14_75]|nr:MAG: ABC-2 family transporter protein [Candidatus Lokiarchaeum sp. GC14_75]